MKQIFRMREDLGRIVTEYQGGGLQSKYIGMFSVENLTHDQAMQASQLTASLVAWWDEKNGFLVIEKTCSVSERDHSGLIRKDAILKVPSPVLSIRRCRSQSDAIMQIVDQANTWKDVVQRWVNQEIEWSKGQGGGDL